MQEQVELLGRERDFPPVDVHPALGGFDPKLAPLDDPILLVARLGPHRLHPAEQRFHPGDQLPHAERLGQVIVRAHLEPEDAVEFSGFGREHQDGHVARQRADLLANAEAVKARQHQIQDDEVVVAGFEPFYSGVAVGFHLRVALDVGQVKLEQLADLGVVFDDQRFSIHLPRINGTWRQA